MIGERRMAIMNVVHDIINRMKNRALITVIWRTVKCDKSAIKIRSEEIK